MKVSKWQNQYFLGNYPFKWNCIQSALLLVWMWVFQVEVHTGFASCLRSDFKRVMQLRCSAAPHMTEQSHMTSAELLIVVMWTIIFSEHSVYIVEEKGWNLVDFGLNLSQTQNVLPITSPVWCVLCRLNGSPFFFFLVGWISTTHFSSLIWSSLDKHYSSLLTLISRIWELNGYKQYKTNNARIFFCLTSYQQY